MSTTSTGSKPSPDDAALEATIAEILRVTEAVERRARVRCFDRRAVCETLEVLGDARRFCAQHGLPETSIRMVISAGDSGHPNAQSTVLYYFGRGWSAYREHSRVGNPFTDITAWLDLTEEEFPRERAKALANTRKDGDGYRLYLFPPGKAEKRVHWSKTQHTWREVTEGHARCETCGLESRNSRLGARSGGPSVRIAGENAWWIVGKMPPCPTTADTPIEIGVAR
jgi:hypothetical protein